MLVSIAFKYKGLCRFDTIMQWIDASTTQKFNGSWRDTPVALAISFDGINWFSTTGEFGEVVRSELIIDDSYRTYKLFVDRTNAYNTNEAAILMIGSTYTYPNMVSKLFKYILSTDTIDKVCNSRMEVLEQVIKGAQYGE